MLRVHGEAVSSIHAIFRRKRMLCGLWGFPMAAIHRVWDLSRMNFRRFVVPAAIVVLLLVAVFVYTARIEPNWLRVARYHVADSEVPVLVAQLTDLHVVDEAALERVERAVTELETIRPDAIVLTGDYVGRRLLFTERYRKALRRLTEIAPVYGIGGNHDGGLWAGIRGGYPTSDTMRAFMESAGIRYLRNETESLDVRGRRLEIFGAGDIWSGDLVFDPDSVFSNDSATTKIVLTHSPDTRVRFDSVAWDLMLCGHTHGGQVELPFIGAPILPIEDKRFGRGLYRMGTRTLVVSPGVGNLRGIRFGCRPEIGLIEI